MLALLPDLCLLRAGTGSWSMDGDVCHFRGTTSLRVGGDLFPLVRPGRGTHLCSALFLSGPILAPVGWGGYLSVHQPYDVITDG